MFADIEGYTSMFQQNETAGLAQIQAHRAYLTEVVTTYHGTIIQYFGDGSLTVFDSVIDAVHCSIALQLESRKQAIPLRIGIHIGDLVMRSHDVFGDVVNVASRIQSAGVAGSVVVSKKVADELGNQPDLKLKYLGNFTLKNVIDPQDLYGLVFPGLIVPGKHHESRRWKKTAMFTSSVVTMAFIGLFFFKDQIPFLQNHTFETEQIYVHPFENKTMDPALDIYADITKEWINNDLLYTAEAHVMSSESVIAYTNADLSLLTKNPDQLRKMGADLIVQGSFSLTGKNRDTLLFMASISDTRTNKLVPVHIPRTYCSIADSRACLNALSNSITGFWKTKDGHVFSHPTNDAYIAYVQARQRWAEPDQTVAMDYVRTAIRLDTTFWDAYFLLLDGFYNNRMHQNALDTLKLIRTRFQLMSPEQSNFLHYHEEDLKGRRSAAFAYFLQDYLKQPKDLFKNTSAMVMAIEYLNDPVMALSFYKEIDADSFDLNTFAYCRTRLLMAMIAYRSVSDIPKARAIADRLKLLSMRQSEFSRLIDFYVSIGDTTSVESVLNRLQSRPDQMKMVPYLTFTAARQALLSGDMTLKDKYARRAAQLYSPSGGRNYARCLYLLDEYSAAEEIYRDLIDNDNAGYKALGELGMLYAKQQNKAQALEMITMLKNREDPFAYGEVKYMIGRIYAHLGDRKEALTYLKRSLEEGFLFSSGISFQHDPDLIILHSEPEYLQLLSKNRLTTSGR